MKRKLNITKEETIPDLNDEEMSDQGSGEYSDDEEPETEMKDEESGNKSKKRKIQYKKDLLKPPTSQEISALRETENLFQSSLFRLQVEELLKEVKMKTSDSLRTFLMELKEFLMNIVADDHNYTLAEEDWINDVGYKVPFEQLPNDEKVRFYFSPPSKVDVFGSYANALTCKSNAVIDVGVELPKGFILKGDNLNFRYHRKRAMYLLRLTHELRSFESIDEMRFSHFNGDSRKPCLLIKPLGKLSKKVTICIFPYCSRNSFFEKKLIPVRNNIRPSWFYKTTSIPENTPTSFYNFSIFHDMMFEENTLYIKNLIGDAENVRNGILLFKVWAHQREFDKGFGGFGSFIQTMFIGYLLKTKKLNRLMSSYQIMRTVWINLASSNWDSEGISLCNSWQDGMPSLCDFKDAFEVVFLDSTGYLNITAHLSKVTYQRVKTEADLAIKILDSSENYCFDALFMIPIPFVRKFDNYLILKSEGLKKAFAKLEQSSFDCGDYSSRKFISKIIDFLRTGLGERVSQIDFRLTDPLIWDLTDDFSQVFSNTLTIGLALDTQFSGNFINKVPADSNNALSFRQFWGEKAQLHHYPDNMYEAVVWPGSSISDKRSVCKHVVSYVLTRHTDVDESDIWYSGVELDAITQVQQEQFKMSAEEHMLSIIKTLETLGKDIRKLDLDLLINSVQGISPTFRYLEVFPPTVYPSKCNVRTVTFKKNNLLLKDSLEVSPFWIRPLEVILNLETSSKWPEDLSAIRRLKAAFHIRLGQALKSAHKLNCVPNLDYVDVLKDGYVFRLIVTTVREIIAVKATTTPQGVLKFQDNEESRSLELRTQHLPTLSSALHGLQMRHSMFSPVCRLAKRWVSSQLLWHHINEITIELIVAFLFTNSHPYSPPNSPQSGFLRFLQLLHSFDWKNLPLIVNLNDELKKEEITEIETKFFGSRPNLPTMFIATPYDKYESMWTKEFPLPQIVYRLQCLAKEAQKVLELQILNPTLNFDCKIAFRPPLNSFDVVIHLLEDLVPTANYGIDYESGKKLGTMKPDRGRTPVIGFNPIVCYMKELKDMFDDIAMFFYDYYGGKYIAVLFKPTAFQFQPFKVSNIGGKMIAGDITSKPIMITPNVSLMVDEFINIGKGLVKSVEKKSKNCNLKT